MRRARDAAQDPVVLLDCDNTLLDNDLLGLITWNCKHIANAVIFRSVERACRKNGYEPPVMCTPEALMEP